MRKENVFRRPASVALAIAAGAAGAGISAASLSAPALAMTRAHSMAAPLVKVATVAKYGKILVNAKGIALYYNTANKPPHHWACTGECLTVWPPLLMPKTMTKPVAGKGVTGLGVVKSPSGEQVTWKGKPLYTYVPDTKGTVKGQGLFKVWYVTQLKAAQASTGTGYGSGW